MLVSSLKTVVRTAKCLDNGMPSFSRGVDILSLYSNQEILIGSLLVLHYRFSKDGAE
jgi:hypothetical protein